MRPLKEGEEKAFIAAITITPEEDTPRLVYADWLDEHNRPGEAEMIRHQIQHARGKKIPPVVNEETIQPYLKRDGFGIPSGGENKYRHPDIPEHVSDYCLSRGFIYGVTLLGPAMSGGAGDLGMRHPLAEVTLYEIGRKGGDSASFEDVQHCLDHLPPSVKKLNLNGNPGFMQMVLAHPKLAQIETLEIGVDPDVSQDRWHSGVKAVGSFIRKLTENSALTNLKRLTLLFPEELSPKALRSLAERVVRSPNLQQIEALHFGVGEVTELAREIATVKKHFAPDCMPHLQELDGEDWDSLATDIQTTRIPRRRTGDGGRRGGGGGDL